MYLVSCLFRSRPAQTLRTLRALGVEQEEEGVRTKKLDIRSEKGKLRECLGCDKMTRSLDFCPRCFKKSVSAAVREMKKEKT